MSPYQPPPPPPIRADALISYWALRQLIGILGLIMPLVLPLGTKLIRGSGILEPSISHYYYSIMHIVFMAILCMLGSFLLTYRGISKYPKWERLTSIIAGLFAFGVAAFPTSFSGYQDAQNSQFISLCMKDLKDVPKWVDILHHVFAATLFSSFAFFCFFFFQDSDTGVHDAKKKRRNTLYIICGILIVLSILAIVLVNFVIKSWNFPNSTFVFETTALLPFGFSWLVKGSVNWPHSKSVVLRKSIRLLR
jgi:amino acid transporter